MSKIKIFNVFLTILLLLILISTIIIYIIVEININNPKVAEYEVLPTYELEETLQPVKNKMDFYVVRESINKYYSYGSVIFNAKDYYETENQEILKQAEQENSIVLLNMLDEEFIQAKDVTKDNIKTKLTEIDNPILNITNMYVSEKTNNINVYVAKGLIKEATTGNLKTFEIIVKVDLINKTFSIIPQEYIQEQYKELIVGKKIAMDIQESIQANDNNIIEYRFISDESYAKDLFTQFRTEILYFTESVYNRLDEKYRNEKFSTLEDFKEYIKNNEKRYSQISAEKYEKKITNNYTQYTYIDQSNNCYIFKEDSIMNYSLILDTYTIDFPEFVEKYTTAIEQVKVGMNIEKIVSAINDSDYKYVYNKLDNIFRDNNFIEITDFKNYMQNNFFRDNNIEYLKFSQEGDVYIYKVKITEKGNVNSIPKFLNIIMQLGEGTEFTISFSFE